MKAVLLVLVMIAAASAYHIPHPSTKKGGRRLLGVSAKGMSAVDAMASCFKAAASAGRDRTNAYAECQQKAREKFVAEGGEDDDDAYERERGRGARNALARRDSAEDFSQLDTLLSQPWAGFSFPRIALLVP